MGELAPADLVWKDGLPEWRPASMLKGLFSEIRVQSDGPPPLPPVAVESTRQSGSSSVLVGLVGAAEAKTDSYRRKRIRPSRFFIWAGLVGAGLLSVLVLFGLFGNFLARRPAYLAASANPPGFLGAVPVASADNLASHPTHIVAEDVTLTVAGVGALDDEVVSVTLFFQHAGEPLAGEGKKGRVVLTKGTGLALLKSEMRTTNIKAYLCDFVRVEDGPHKGLAGWLVDLYVLPNR